MFGAEQGVLQSKALLRFIYRTVGEFKYPLRLRGYYLAKAASRLSHTPQAIWDAGSGAGQSSFYLTQRWPQSKLLGSDLDPQEVEHCDEIVNKAHIKNVNFCVENLLETTYDQQFDLVVSFDVLFLVDDVEKGMANMSRALRQGGEIILHTPAISKYTSPQFGLRRWLNKNRPLPSYLHVRLGLSKSELEQLCAKNGLHIEHLDYTFGELAMHAHTIYEQTRSRTLFILAAFPFLFLCGILDWYLPKNIGGGLLLHAKKL
jgi:SAM-dependent methyltransferase